ncbi:carbohydrate ABC transporter permease [Paenibacillus cymbidii]|uniref:carbohydrate ABC transporter permease n=1 Tax=Paenibacillus cymbidii TaxID=1639034 RepID=UPI001F268EC6|nr:carbohydrate ABC transporter permease [Paenibacillus cymbidii]
MKAAWQRREGRRLGGWRGRWFDYGNYAFMTVLSLTILYPFWQLVILSFSDAAEATTLGFHFWPAAWRMEAYRFLFSTADVTRAYVNTILRTAIGTGVMLLFTVIAAYPLSKRELPLRGIITVYLLVPMFFSGGLVPTYLLVKRIGLLDNFWVLILPTALSFFYMIIMRNYFMSLDKAFEESAFIDGANDFQLLWSIILPLSAPVLATVSLWSAVHHWNAWFDAMIYIRDRDKTVIQFILREMLVSVDNQARDIVQYNSKIESQLALSNVRAAISLVSIGPIIFAYPYVQKYFIKGIMLGSLKG